ncbi:hypothetical protein D3C80_1603580 [compost metagenome]
MLNTHAVVAHRNRDIGTGGGEVGQFASQAIAHKAEGGLGDLVQIPQRVEGGGDVVYGLVQVQCGVEAQSLIEICGGVAQVDTRL